MYDSFLYDEESQYDVLQKKALQNDSSIYLADEVKDKGVFNEKFAQSVAQQVILYELSKKSLSDAEAKKVSDILLRINKEYVKFFKDFMQYRDQIRKELGHPDEMSLLFSISWDIEKQFGKEYAEQIIYSYRQMGYFLEPYTLDEIQSLLS